jgi:hypothetical protein
MKPTGYLVMESCENYEQALAIDRSDGLPDGGILTWADPKHMRTMFYTREAARAAIDRTEHYRLAYGRTDLPEKKHCSIAPVQFGEAEPAP